MIDIFFTIFIYIWLIMMAVFSAIAIGAVIFETKVAEARANADAMAKKKQRERIMEVLAKKQDESLESHTEEELLAMLENL